MFLFKTLKESVNEFKKLQTIVTTALLTALHTILGFFSFMIGNFIKVTWSFITLAIAGMMYGPIAAGVLGALGDIINYLLQPKGPFFPGFTLNAFLTGLIYGFALYKKSITIPRIFIGKLVIVVLVDLLLGTYWLSILYGNAFFVLLPIRILKSAILLPIETFILYYILTRIQTISGSKQSK